MKNLVATLLLCLTLFSSTIKAQVNNYNVIWKTPSQDSWGSMPIGNGDIGTNIWVSPQGEINFYISKTDTWSENGRLLKIAKVKVRFTPNILQGIDFKQELDLKTGTIKISGKKDNQTIDLSFWVDANNPVIILDGKSSIPVKAEVIYKGWRNKTRELTKKELPSAYGIMESPDPIIVEADIIKSIDNGLMWYHRNNRSIWNKTLEIQAIDEFSNSMTDPLLNKTFGAFIKGNGFIKTSDTKLVSTINLKDIEISIYPYTAQTNTADIWVKELLRKATIIEKEDLKKRKKEHVDWWQKFWTKHYIYVNSEKDTKRVYNMTRGYVLQRYMNACSGRGNMPIKFNGSIFTVDVPRPVKKNFNFDADYRDWGGCYWWQNTRLPYWAMLYSGDFEMMKPLFDMYIEALPLAKFRTKKYYKHEGAMFPETMFFWGTWTLDNYGWDRKGKPDGLSDNMYIRYEWQGSIELIAMMLDYYSFKQDNNYLKNTILPFTKEILTFYDLHYKRNESGKIIFDPAQALETYWEGTINPMPEIAGLYSVTQSILDLEKKLIGKELLQLCEKIQKELPHVPTTTKNGVKLLSPAEILGPKKNVENPELYAVFPYKLFRLGKSNLDMAINTYKKRIHKDYSGWQQDGIQAAYLGLTEEASHIVLENFNTKHKGSRFPAFWGPNYDWVPDQDHGGVNMIILQSMLIQSDGKKILLFPSWNPNWDVDFVLHAPLNTIISGKLKDGKLEKLSVTPEFRKKDIVNYLNLK